MRRGTFFNDFPVTSTLLLLCLGFYALEVYYTDRNHDQEIVQSILSIDGEVLYGMGANNLSLVKQGEIWRLLSCAFLHAGLIHILFNAWVLSDLGRICEPLLGRERFAVAYVACALGGSLGTLGYAAVSGRVNFSIGASGAIVGFIGLLLAFSIRHKDRHLRDAMMRWVIYIVIITVYIHFSGIVSIDHAAHAGGFIVGFIFGFFTPRYVSSQGAKAWRIPFWIAIVVTAASLGMALAHYFKGPRF
jgi:rhomboid protease GluP